MYTRLKELNNKSVDWNKQSMALKQPEIDPGRRNFFDSTTIDRRSLSFINRNMSSKEWHFRTKYRIRLRKLRKIAGVAGDAIETERNFPSSKD